MTNIPNELRFTKEHEWIRLQDEIAIVGITDHAQSELGDIVFVELPEPGKEINQGQEFGVVESVKTVSNLYSPVSGKIKEINHQLVASPETVNKDPYGQGWMIKLENVNKDELELLLPAEEYQRLIGE